MKDNLKNNFRSVPSELTAPALAAVVVIVATPAFLEVSSLPKYNT